MTTAHSQDLGYQEEGHSGLQAEQDPTHFEYEVNKMLLHPLFWAVRKLEGLEEEKRWLEVSPGVLHRRRI